MSRKVFAIANGIMAAMFLLSAVLQYNDPDPLRWIALYAAAALACATDSGMSQGPLQKPQANIPLALVSHGEPSAVTTKPRLSTRTRSIFASRRALGLGTAAVARTAMSSNATSGFGPAAMVKTEAIE